MPESCLTYHQIWDIFEGKHLFHGQDPSSLNPNGTGYTTRAHLVEVVGMLGLPPVGLLERGNRSQEFFTKDGTFKNAQEECLTLIVM